MKRKLLFLGAGSLIMTALFLYFGFKIQAEERVSDQYPGNRADVIHISAMKKFGPLERDGVRFLHDKHTDVLVKENNDCLSCHQSKDNKLSYKFMRLEDTDKKSVTDIYHNGCISCHKKRSEEGVATGPVECGKCHSAESDPASSRQPMGMDKSLHYRHTKAYEKKCETCHHEYNPETKKLFYAKEKEGTCRYCHKEKTEENRISMELASHASCIECHMKKLAEKKDAGPVKCSGCHDPEKQKLIKKVEPVPRIERKQPDFVMIKTGDKNLDAPDKARMDFVPFNHKAHEASYDTCRVCHHGELSSCGKCHTIEGTKEGNNIPLERAMHKAGTEKSCDGCHAASQKDKNCSGCHAFLSQTSKQEASSCRKCHVKPLPETAGKESAVVAEKLLSSKIAGKTAFETKNIPKKIIIKALSDKYEPVEFPHRQIVDTLTKNMKDDHLAGYFHDEKGTLCRGCHHHGPVSEKPSGCGHCHENSVDKADIMRPSLKGAYHIQCMDCHTNMGVKKTGCTDCHKEKVK